MCRITWRRTAIAAALVGLTAGCQRPVADRSATEQAEASQPETAALVPIVRPERKTVRHAIEQPGFNIEAFKVAPLFSRITGYVGKWETGYDLGKEVTKDEVLAELYVPEMVEDLKQKQAAVKQAQAQIQQAQATKQSAEAQLVRSRSQYERLKRKAAGALDEDTIEETRLGYEAAQAGLEKAKADVASAQAHLGMAEASRDYSKAMLDYAQIRAPFGGVITARNINEGDFVRPSGVGPKGLPLFVISQMDPVRVFVNIPTTDARWIKDGDAVTLRLQGAGGEEIEGHVTRNARSLDPAARTLRTEIDLPNPMGKLLPGMYVQARILVERRGVWTLPASAILTEGDQPLCYRVVKGKAVRAPLQVGLRGGGLVQVLRKQLPGAALGEEGRWEDISRDDEIAADPAAVYHGQLVRTAAAGK
jgi:RND family efflux transporter MFP subunit